jgi:GTP cyclohydrolase II
MRPDRPPLPYPDAPSGSEAPPARHVRADGAVKRAAVRIDRAATELRRGRPVRLTDGTRSRVVLAIETLLPVTWSALSAQGQGPAGIRLILSGERAAAAGWAEAASPMLSLALPAQLPPTVLGQLAGLDHAGVPVGALPAGVAVIDTSNEDAAIGEAALELARLARLVPAAAVFHLPSGDLDPLDEDILSLDLADLALFASDRAVGLARIAEAPVPLAGHEQCRFVLFRETTADFEHVAIVVGDPDPAGPVTVRLHSSCLTGDLFGSLRCDCGDQLRGAMARLQEEGGGVLLYLSQEGRGIGLANKLRAYTRQDAGLDTIDADRYLGFRGDERRFAIAARMLQELGVRQVRLLTNNPAKIAALVEAGITVVERLPIGGAVTPFNARYLATKRDRAGHLIDAPAAPVSAARPTA